MTIVMKFCSLLLMHHSGLVYGVRLRHWLAGCHDSGILGREKSTEIIVSLGLGIVFNTLTWQLSSNKYHSRKSGIFDLQLLFIDRPAIVK